MLDVMERSVTDMGSSAEGTDGVERRREPREPARISASLQIGHEIFDCTIVDLSANGVRVQTDEHRPVIAACVGQQMILDVPGAQAVAVTIRWIRARSMGLQFLATLDSWGDFPVVRRFGRPLRWRSGRAQVSIPVTFNVGSRRCRGKITDMSVGGAMIETHAELKFGEQIILESDLIRPIGAYVRWQKLDNVGVMFGRVLPVDSAKIIADTFNIHAMWMTEVIKCHEGAIDWLSSTEMHHRRWWRVIGA